MDELLVRAEYAASHAGAERLDALRRDACASGLRARLGVHPVVELVPEGTLAAHRVQGPPRDRRPRSLPGDGQQGARSMSGVPDPGVLAAELAGGSVRALARGLTWIEEGGPAPRP